MRIWPRFSLKRLFLSFTVICVFVAAARFVSQRRSLERQIIANGTLAYGTDSWHEQTAHYTSRFGSGTTGPDPQIVLRDPNWFPALGKWANGSLVVCPINSIRSQGARRPYLNQVLASGELRFIKLSHYGHDEIDWSLISRNRRLAKLTLSYIKESNSELVNLHLLQSLRELRMYSTDRSLRPLARTTLPDSLETIHLCVTGIESEDLSSLCACQQLKELDLSGNPIDLSACAELGLPDSLEKISLRHTRLTLSDLRAIANCSQLQSLDLFESGIDLRNCDGVELPVSLTSLDLTNAILDASSFRMLSKLPNLRRLMLNDAEFSDDAVDVQLASTIECFGAGNTKAGPNVLRAISRADNLAILNLYNAKIDDRTLALLGEKPSLKILLLDNSDLTDACVLTLKQCKNLERLQLSGTQITDELFFEAPHLLKVDDLRVSESRVSEEIQAQHLAIIRSKRRENNGKTKTQYRPYE